MADPADIVAVLANLTGDLEFAPRVHSAHLEKVRRLIADAIARGQIEAAGGLASIRRG